MTSNILKFPKVQVIKRPEDAYSLLENFTHKDTEHFGAIYLNNQNEVIRTECLFMGGQDKTVIDPKVVFWRALETKASAMIIWHNHPSGNTSPSTYDMDTTKKLSAAGKLLNIQILDHVIVSKTGYFSFLEHDILKSED